MARYVRRRPALIEKDYRRYREQIRDDFRTECAYCFVGEFWSGGPEAMQLDHFRPQSLFPELASAYDNLYYACGTCNQRKSNQWPSAAQRDNGAGFVDACEDSSDEHYRMDRDGILSPLTTKAEYTIDACRLNRPHLCAIRHRLGAMGEFAL